MDAWLVSYCQEGGWGKWKNRFRGYERDGWKDGSKGRGLDMYYNKYYLPQCLDYARQTRLNEYGPTLPMSVHMVMSVHVGEPVLVWHAASGLKEPTSSAWCLTISHFFSLFSVDHPFISPHLLLAPSVSLGSWVSLSFWGQPQHAALPGSHGLQLNILMSLPSCVVQLSSIALLIDDDSKSHLVIRHV